MIVPLLAGATIRMVGSLNRGAYIFENQANWAITKLGVPGFSAVWPHYLKITTKDSGSHVFLIAARIVNLLSLIYVTTNAYYYSFVEVTDNQFLRSTNIFLIFYSVVFWIINEIYTYRKMNLKKVVPEIAINMDRARKCTLKEMEQYSES